MPGDIKRRVFRHAFEDGIFEIVFGVVSLFIGLFFLGYSLVPENSRYRLALPFGYLSVFLLSLFLIKKMIRSLKAKITYPRTGYVSFQDQKQKRLKAGIRGALAGGIVALIGGLIKIVSPVLVPDFYSLPTYFGLALALILCLISFRSGLVRFAILGVFSLTIGLVFSFAALSHMQSISAFLGCVGVSLLAIGWLSSRRYVRRHPLPREGD